MLTGVALIRAAVTVAYDGFTGSPAGTVASLCFLVLSVGLLVQELRRRSASPADPQAHEPVT